MKTFAPIKVVKFLQKAFTEIAMRINERTPIPGNGISVSELPQGFVIALRDPNQKPPDQLADDSTDYTNLLTALMTPPSPFPFVAPNTHGTPAAFVSNPWLESPDGSVGWQTINLCTDPGVTGQVEIPAIPADPITGFGGFDGQPAVAAIAPTFVFLTYWGPAPETGTHGGL